MFNNDITKTYEMLDATFEILIMLAGAFLLGALFSWALSKLRGDKSTRKQTYQRKTVDQQNGFRQPVQQAGASYPDDFDTGNIAKKTGADAIVGGSATAIGSGITNVGSSAGDKSQARVANWQKLGQPLLKVSLILDLTLKKVPLMPFLLRVIKFPMQDPLLKRLHRMLSPLLVIHFLMQAHL
jgi:hypothetical protein